MSRSQLQSVPLVVEVSLTAHNWALCAVASASQAAWQVAAPLGLPAKGPPMVVSVIHILVCACAGSMTALTIGLAQNGEAKAMAPKPMSLRLFLFGCVFGMMGYLFILGFYYALQISIA